MGKNVLGVFLASVAMFFWGFIFWGLLPFPFQVLKPVGDEDRVMQTLNEALPATGTYLFPLPREGETMESQSFLDRHTKGPMGQIFFVKEGVAPGGMEMLVGFIHFLISAALMTALLGLALPSLPRYGQRVTFVVLAGVVAAVFIQMSQPIWFHHPAGFYGLYFIYDVLAWLFGGLVLAKFIKPPEPA